MDKELQNKSIDKELIGKYIYQKRVENNLTQQELADKLYVSDRAVSKWERGLSIPDIEIIVKLSEIFNVNVKDILKGTETDEPIDKKNKLSLTSLIIIPILTTLFMYFLITRTTLKTDPYNYLTLLHTNFNIFPFLEVIECIIYGPKKIIINSIIRNVFVNASFSLIVSLLILKYSNSKKQYKNFSLILLIGMEFIKWLLLLGIFDISDIIIRLIVAAIIYHESKKLKKNLQ